MNDMSLIALCVGVVGVVLAWFRTSSYRFQFYSVCEDAEESLRLCCVKMNELAFWLPMPEGCEPANYADILNSYAVELRDRMWRAELFHDNVKKLNSILTMLIGRNKIVVDNDVVYAVSVPNGTVRQHICTMSEVTSLLSLSKSEADKALKTCRDMKKKLEGIFYGNCYALRILFRNKPFTKRAVLRMIGDTSQK